MKALSVLIAVFVLASSPATAQDTGRTDGPEGSEFTLGGYPFGGPLGRVYLNGGFGTGFFDKSGIGNSTGFLYGFDLGYEIDQWIGIQGSYNYLSDKKMSIYSLGSRFAYTTNPFVYHFSLQAGVYDPQLGSTNFGLAPGAGIDIIVHDKVRIGLDYKHDFIFTDGITTDQDRVYAGLKFYF